MTVKTWSKSAICAVSLSRSCFIRNDKTVSARKMSSISTKTDLNAPLSLRIVFIFDHAHRLYSTSQQQQSTLMHPNSPHIMSRYATQHHHRSYNYNDIGEFVLHLAPAEQIKTKQQSSSVAHGSTPVVHSLYLWPDNIRISNLTELEVPSLYSLFNKVTLIEPREIALDPSRVSIAAPKIIVVVNTTKLYTWERATSAVQWLKEISSYSPFDVEFIITKDVIDANWEVLFLNGHNVESAIGPLSESQAKDLMQRYLSRQNQTLD